MPWGKHLASEMGLKIQQLFSLMSCVQQGSVVPWEGHTTSTGRHTWGTQSPKPPTRHLAYGTVEKPQGIFFCDIKRNTIISVPGALSLLSLLLDVCTA